MRRMEAASALKAEAHAREAAVLRDKCEDLQRQLLAMHTAAGSLSLHGAPSAGQGAEKAAKESVSEPEGEAQDQEEAHREALASLQ